MWVCVKCHESSPTDDTHCTCGASRTKDAEAPENDKKSEQPSYSMCDEQTDPSTKEHIKKIAHVRPMQNTLRDAKEVYPCSQCNGQKDSPQDPCAKYSELEKTGNIIPVPKSSIDAMEHELRIILIGKTGVGKSATGNTMLKDEVFVSKNSPDSVTTACKLESRERWGRLIQVIDTPGLLDTKMTKEEISKEIKKSVVMSHPGPHAFLLFVSMFGRFTDEDKQVLKEIDGMFGKSIKRNMIIVFTQRDQADEKSSSETFIKRLPVELKEVLESAGGRYVTVSNKGSAEEKEKDARKLFDCIINMLVENGGRIFSSDMFIEADRIMQQRIDEVLEMKKEELRKEIEQQLRKEMEQIVKEQQECILKLQDTNIEMKGKLEIEGKPEVDEETEIAASAAAEVEEERILGELVHEEMVITEKEKKLTDKIEKKEGPKNRHMKQELAHVGEQIKNIIAKKKLAEEKITNMRISAATDLRKRELREEEKQKIENEEKETLGRYQEVIKSLGLGYVNMFE